MSMPVALLPKVRSASLMRAINGMPCSLRIASFAGLSCAPQNTVVGCHLPVTGKGTSTKTTDLAVVAGCARCHDILDNRNEVGSEIRKNYPAAYGHQLLNALVETQARLVASGIIVVVDGEVI